MNAADILYNTPGYYYAIAYTLAAAIIVITRQRRLARWTFAAASVFFFAALLAFMIYTHGAQGGTYIISMALIFGWIVLYLYLCGTFSFREAVLFCAKTVISGELAASLCWQILYYSSRTYERGYGWRCLEMVLVYSVLFTGMYFLEQRLQTDEEKRPVTIQEVSAVLLLSLTVYVVSNLSYLDSDTLFSGNAVMDIFIIRTLVDLSGVAILYANQSQIREFQLRLENEKLNHLVQRQWAQYQMSCKNAALVNQKYHDMKHLITVLETEADPKKTEGYLREWKQAIRQYETQNQTGSPILDVVLSEAHARCREQGIELKYMLDGKLLAFMKDMDLSVLFGNILDNAIECVSKHTGQKRTIRLYAAGEKQFFRLLAENICEEELHFKSGLPETTKNDRQNHGYGMKSIRSIVEKYGGSVVATQENGWFRLKILIPLH